MARFFACASQALTKKVEHQLSRRYFQLINIHFAVDFVTLVIYRRTETLPEGIRRPISNVVPVWWELTTTTEGGNVPNDFSFGELKPYLIDYE